MRKILHFFWYAFAIMTANNSVAQNFWEQTGGPCSGYVDFVVVTETGAILAGGGSAAWRVHARVRAP